MCNCISEVESKVIQHLKEANPSRIYHEPVLHFLGTGLQNYVYSPSYSPFLSHLFKIEYHVTKKDGTPSKARIQSIGIYPTFCGFCGQRLSDNEANDIAEEYHDQSYS